MKNAKKVQSRKKTFFRVPPIFVIAVKENPIVKLIIFAVGHKRKSQNKNIMKNKILLTTAIAFIGLFSFSVIAEANPGHNNRHKHVSYRHGTKVVVWHNNYNQCGGGYMHHRGNQRPSMCLHMSTIWNGGRCGNAVVRCNHRGCGMYGQTYRNGQFYGNGRGQGYHQGHGNGGRYNQGGGRGNHGNNKGGGRGNGRGNGSGRGNGGR